MIYKSCRRAAVSQKVGDLRLRKKKLFRGRSENTLRRSTGLKRTFLAMLAVVYPIRAVVQTLYVF